MRLALALGVLFSGAISAQIIEFESGGLKYRALTRGGVTIMWAHLPMHIREYAVLQVAISNGSPVSWQIKPQDFHFEKAEGGKLGALPAAQVVQWVMDKAGRGDVVKLITAYESALFGNARVHSTNGYEVRRQDAQAELGGGKFRAAAAASAIALVPTKLAPGQSTDGAIFFLNGGKPLGAGKLLVNAAGETFEFPVEMEIRTK
ncbi:MAG TPA: hypothetical protein VMT15_21215 [Bryobacteraceae bacterium]|nr:hypothetical protein [Bryobacteraceae bacterium]